MSDFKPWEVDVTVSEYRQPDDEWSNGWWLMWNQEIDKIEDPVLGTIERVANKKFPFDQYETDGAPIFVVVKVGDQYFQKEGVYASWDGTNMDGECVEVEPVEVPLTFYRHKE